MRSAPWLRVILAAFVLLEAGCGGEPPPPRGESPSSSASPAAMSATSPGSAQPAARASSSSTTGASPPSAAAAATPSVLPSASTPPVALDLAQHPRLFGDDGKPLGQTDDVPSASSPAFLRRMELLWSAIQANDPALASEAVFFPKVAYAQVKDIEKPEADWKSRLVRAFERNVRGYHKKLGDRPEACRFVGVEIDEKRVKVMARGKEGNKLPYHRVTRSKIEWLDADGKARTFELTSLIAWRGEWFVVHLDGFK